MSRQQPAINEFSRISAQNREGCEKRIYGGVRKYGCTEKEEMHTIDDIYALPDGERAELIDGKIYYMAPPSRTHQRISGKLYQTIANYKVE